MGKHQTQKLKWIIAVIVVALIVFFLSRLHPILKSSLSNVTLKSCNPNWVLDTSNPVRMESSFGTTPLAGPLSDEACKSSCYNHLETTAYKIERDVPVTNPAGDSTTYYDKCYCDINKC